MKKKRGGSKSKTKRGGGYKNSNLRYGNDNYKGNDYKGNYKGGYNTVSSKNTGIFLAYILLYFFRK